ncbi:phosphoglucomutase (alpha-D-glucose-1,6-bisphosphate-dependent) [Shewanella sp. NIFS-20-20]|uniref:phosphoglucomutase (alpha-D-glucose-1,6-bisphosphate-dependent) n=1 Tax=Shewanella sp. NIFS-20-20 TaxID=2853806 RepID=UPI001C44AC49|nr:phosphoglucomutase (alpha-D-glucose-1,6-bisphosphate-dependent) [Shewanella sp. NIFS-20-20]
MALHPRAGRVADASDLIDLPSLLADYYTLVPCHDHASQAVSFGTSGHRGSSSLKSFNQLHLWAITQAVVDYRQWQGIVGPMLVGIDTHALSRLAYRSVVEVLVANRVPVIAQQQDGYTPTPVVSRYLVDHNRQTDVELMDGLIITPSHNPPSDGGIKYNPPHGGPADSDATSWIETRANQYLAQQMQGVKRVNYQLAVDTGVEYRDLYLPYISQLQDVIDMQAIAKANVKIGVDPLGGSGLYYWRKIAEHYQLDITVLNDKLDPSFSFMPLDKDGKIRMDCSSNMAMAGVVPARNQFDICIANDPDFDRHGIVCPDKAEVSGGLMDPNHYLAVAIDYLLSHRPDWPTTAAVGKTLVSSALIDRICAARGRQLLEVPVGFKWFVDGLQHSQILFGGEESAGASMLQRDGQTWCTDKDGFILGLLAAEIFAVTGQTPAERYHALTQEFGASVYERIDSPINAKKKARFSHVNQASVTATTLAGDDITAVLTHAPGNGAAIGGLKVCTANGWFAARPSGTEPLFKLYAESFVSAEHLKALQHQAKAIMDQALKG